MRQEQSLSQPSSAASVTAGQPGVADKEPLARAAATTQQTDSCQAKPLARAVATTQQPARKEHTRGVQMNALTGM